MPPPSDNSGQDTRKWKKEKKYVRKDDAVFPFDGNPTDRVIALWGDRRWKEHGHDLTSRTAKIQHTVVEMPREKKRNRVIILDTPGFDDTYVDDAEILRRISVWLATSLERFNGTYESACNIVEYVLREDHENKYIPETSAGSGLEHPCRVPAKTKGKKLPEDQIVKTQKAIQTLDKRSMTDKFKDFLKL
ncbi:hypothetical protein BDQ17DRAFT_1326610 [Cyathus striatus]|nr:hypothetical protein BDQ17DRAFT_1326610 [Cyathus striatus]